MTVLELLYHNVPLDIFTLKENSTLVEQAQNLIDQCHPGATNMKVLNLTAEISEADIPYSQNNRALHGFMHGGCFFTVGDTLTSIMAFFHVENEKERTFTMDASIRYLRPVRTETVYAKARLVQKNGKLLEYVCDFFNEENKRAAQAKYKYVIAEPH
ncbi:PaaI family thioesterase [Leptospira vanthielii]|uniref:PaaI family thioesterase n=1 Tax=Leptospira vanthielii TaxID=293085 RepID=A0ABY2NM05_9LEPT|nr:PaaI family thioesterase [Leptospira vanthielii]TGM52219.1 PaaI family thioesterase [Leptospira vanthielii]